MTHVSRLRGIRERYPLEPPEVHHRRRLGRMDRAALWFTDVTGDARFFGVLGLGILAWMLWNSLAPRPWRFDPFPSFLMLLGAAKLIQLLFMPLLMVGQKLQSGRAKAQSDAAHRAALRGAEETQLILERIGELEALIRARLPGDPGEEGP